jgi:hypothetical protein
MAAKMLPKLFSGRQSKANRNRPVFFACLGVRPRALHTDLLPISSGGNNIAAVSIDP